MEKLLKLSPQEKIRYARQIEIPAIGEEGQLRLKNASVMIVGAGGLGSASALYLATAGIGKIGIVDSEKVELSNLQRQILYDTSSIGASKVLCAKQRMFALNPEIVISPFEVRVSSTMDPSIFDGFAIIIDATDNYETRFFLNEMCVRTGKVFIFGAVHHFYGQMGVFDATSGPCIRCIFRNSPSMESATEKQGLGVISALPGIIGTLQAIEAIKLILGIGRTAVGRLLLFDGLEMQFQEIEIKKDPTCPVCGGKIA